MPVMVIAYGSSANRELVLEVRAEMERQGWKGVMLAERLGMRRATLSARLSGRTELSPGLLTDIARVLGLPAWELMRRAEANLDGQRKASA